MADFYDAILIKPGDGTPLMAVDRDHMAALGGHYDPDWAGMIFPQTQFPATIAHYMKTHGLKGARVKVAYDPEWYSPPMPEPVWEKLPAQWDGLPPIIDNLPPLRWLWVCSPSHNNGKPFDVMWLGDEKWSTKDHKYTPTQALALGWHILATSAEVLDMTHKRMDQANAKRLDRAAKDAIANDFEGSALQVAHVTGRTKTSAMT